MLNVYFEEIHRILYEVMETQKSAMEEVAGKMSDAIQAKKNIYVFGCSHAGILAQELFYRTGGIVVINPILAPGLTLDVRPVTMTSEIERLDGYGKIIVKTAGIGDGDVLIVHSVSGRNSVPVEVAIEAQKCGAYVAGLTNLQYSRSVSPRGASGKRLFEVCDTLLDNCGCEGDSVCEIQGLSEKVAASSTVVGAAILNAIVARTVELVIAAGVVPPVFISANVEGGDEHNASVLRSYRDNVKYM